MFRRYSSCFVLVTDLFARRSRDAVAQPSLFHLRFVVTGFRNVDRNPRQPEPLIDDRGGDSNVGSGKDG